MGFCVSMYAFSCESTFVCECMYVSVSVHLSALLFARVFTCLCLSTMLYAPNNHRK